MIYIRQEERDKYREVLAALNKITIESPGELGYLFSLISQLYYQNNGFLGEVVEQLGGTGYRALNDIIGALECTKLELYRRLNVPYEDMKIKENGDIKDILENPNIPWRSR